VTNSGDVVMRLGLSRTSPCSPPASLDGTGQ